MQGFNVRGFALLTMGESWHNNHHAYPESACPKTRPPSAMKPILRFALHSLLPPLGGASLIAGAAVIIALGRTPPIEILRGAFMVFVGSCLVASIPSVIYAAVMEFAARRGIEPGSRRALWLSAGLGGIVGALLIVAPGGGWKDWPAVILMSSVGLVVGLAVEWFIGQIAREFAPQKSREP